MGVADSVSSHCRSHLNSNGNWCNHNPSNPRFFEGNSKHANRPDVIQWAMINLKRFYAKPRSWLQSLRDTRRTVRQERSEGRERDADVLGVLLHYTELASLRVGFPKESGEFISLDMKFIAKKLGWRCDNDDQLDTERINQGKIPLNRGVKRVWRSVTVLKQAGYLTVHKRFERHLDGEKDYTGLPAVRCIQPKLFWELGINGTKLRAKRDQAAKRLKKKYRSYLNKIETDIQKVINFGKNLSYNRKYKPVGKFRNNLSATQEKQRQQHCFELKQLPENKNLSSDDFYLKYPHLQHSSFHLKK